MLFGQEGISIAPLSDLGFDIDGIAVLDGTEAIASMGQITIIEWWCVQPSNNPGYTEKIPTQNAIWQDGSIY
jgi:hypothetical protein